MKGEASDTFKMKISAEENSLMMYRYEVERAKRSVDMRDELAHLPFEARRVRQRGRGHLDEHDLPDPFRVVLQEALECTEL